VHGPIAPLGSGWHTDVEHLGGLQRLTRSPANLSMAKPRGYGTGAVVLGLSYR
jgi:hypothetical protein